MRDSRPAWHCCCLTSARAPLRNAATAHLFLQAPRQLMASNALPTTEYRLIALAQTMHSGLVALGDELKITQITAAEFELEFRAFVAASGDFNAARSDQQSASSLSKPADAALE